MIKQAFILLAVAIIIGLGLNLISPGQIDYVGAYRELSSGTGPIIPPAAGEGDPQFIDINTAQLEFTTKTALFVDARDDFEFFCGTIPGSINIPFEYLPESDDTLIEYFDSILNVSKDYSLIVFCSGEECDLSLQLGRVFQDFGYSQISIFFGGAREWEKAGLDIERSESCDE